jgi:hypothetical protein
MYLSGSASLPYWKPLGAETFDLAPGIGYTYRKGDGNTNSTGYNWILNP